MILETARPLAASSLDHLVPRGTAADDTRCAAFARRCEALFPASRRLRFLDLGCAGGGLVAEFAERGHDSFGVEGSDFSRMRRRAAWATCPERLATADITEPFRIRTGADGGLVQFDIVSAWEVLEHLPEAGLPAFWRNVTRHLDPAGYFVASVSDMPDRADDGRDYHVTLRPREWWHGSMRQGGLDPVTLPFDAGELPRGPWSAKGDPGFYVAGVLRSSAMEDVQGAATEPVGAPPASEASDRAPAPQPQQAPDAQPGAGLLAAIETWFAHWYPDTAPGAHPVPPFSGAWHHAQAAFADLKARVGAL